MKKEKFGVALQGDSYVFSAAHFLTLDETNRESIHGHNFKLKVYVGSVLLDNSMVIDFLILDKIVKDIIQTLDNKILIAKNDSRLKISLDKSQINIKHADDDISLPVKDCVMLPIENSTAELMAKYVGDAILKKLSLKKMTMKISLEEAVGCIGIYEVTQE